MTDVQGSFRSLFDLTGRVAVVTGAAGVLGQSFCAGLADHGARVAMIDRDSDRVERLAEDLRDRYKAETLAVECDVSSELSVRNMANQVESTLGNIDVLHNNAATKTDDLKGFFASTGEMSLTTWRSVMSVNLDGMFVVAREIGERMAARAHGSIVQTSSIYGLIAPDQRIYEGSRYLELRISTPAVYSASKAGILGLTRHLAAEWASAGVRVNSLVPGGVQSGQNSEFTKRYSSRVPMGRMATPSEMVGALIFLASDASSYVTGQALVVDGGITAW